jgi:hypothetical protein
MLDLQHKKLSGVKLVEGGPTVMNSLKLGLIVVNYMLYIVGFLIC